MIDLESYLCGRWVRGGERATVLVNPATEERLARASADGLDLDAALAFARDRGGPALRSLTFRQRGELLRAVSRLIHAHRDELLALAVENGGNTRQDAKFDVDGASGTLAAYADLAAKLGDARTLLDGEEVALSRSARLFGRHLWTTRLGVAVQVNAFNFPAWGLAEKAACALLAGMPVLTKPATSTALVASRIVQLIVGAGILPEGALSLLCGARSDWLDDLGPQDVLAFTGSGATAGRIRAGRAFTEGATRLNVEADSLNAAVLGPDVELGSELAELFVGDVVRDMTQKAGQKCTALRRVFVPASALGEVAGRIVERLERVRVGDPRRDEVTMGPLATAQQHGDVRAGIEELARAGRIAWSGGESFQALGVDVGRGFFVAPTLLVAPESTPGDAVHAREVFGPVATLLPYEAGVENAAEVGERVGARVAWGGGGLVASLYSDDRAFLVGCLRALGAWHGRVVIGSSKTASQAIPPGTVLPLLLHGGPGRAGGGAELGAHRGLELYMQRLAIQGDRTLLEALSGGP